jgi:hypothetical protein
MFPRSKSGLCPNPDSTTSHPGVDTGRPLTGTRAANRRSLAGAYANGRFCARASQPCYRRGAGLGHRSGGSPSSPNRAPSACSIRASARGQWELPGGRPGVGELFQDCRGVSCTRRPGSSCRRPRPRGRRARNPSGELGRRHRLRMPLARLDYPRHRPRGRHSRSAEGPVSGMGDTERCEPGEVHRGGQQRGCRRDRRGARARVRRSA